MSTTTGTLQTTYPRHKWNWQTDQVNLTNNRPTSNWQMETDLWLMTNFAQVFQPIQSWLNWPISFNGPDLQHHLLTNYSIDYSLDYEDDFCSGCWNVSHQQQFFSELPSPGRSHWHELRTFCHGTLLGSGFSLIGLYFGTYHLVSLAPPKLNATDELASYLYPDLTC